MCKCVCACACVCMCACVCACVHVCMCVCDEACVCLLPRKLPPLPHSCVECCSRQSTAVLSPAHLQICDSSSLVPPNVDTALEAAARSAIDAQKNGGKPINIQVAPEQAALLQSLLVVRRASLGRGMRIWEY